jgi:hypothetical protein
MAALSCLADPGPEVLEGNNLRSTECGITFNKSSVFEDRLDKISSGRVTGLIIITTNRVGSQKSLEGNSPSSARPTRNTIRAKVEIVTLSKCGK